MKKVGITFSILLLLASTNTFAAAYQLPTSTESIIGGLQQAKASIGDNVITVARKYDIGFNAIEAANPQLEMNRAFVSGAPIVIPTKHLLPNQARRGIVINLPEMRMYYYPEGSNQVFTYPIGIGKTGKTIPIQNTFITHKKENPTWIPPQDIREFNLQQGIVLPKILPPGPDNPLGPYAIYTGIPTYLIHSTIFPESVGKRASFGCIRMYQNDIEDFFPSISHGIPVAIINSPVKVGWQNERLFIEAHKPLEEQGDSYNSSLPGIVNLIAAQTNQSTLVDWQLVSYLAKNRDGIPHEVGMRIPSSSQN